MSNSYSGQTSKSTKLKDLNLNSCNLDNMRFFDVVIENCCFDNASCQDWRMWNTKVINCSFKNTNLQNSALGTWYEGKENVFELVDFTKADLRGVVSHEATYKNCNFSYAKLDKIDFQSSWFIKCKFAGEVKKVIFWDYGFRSPKTKPNPMKDVDFSEAVLIDVEFRRLDLKKVLLPKDPTQIIIKNYQCVIRKALQELEDNNEDWVKQLMATLKHERKWLHPNRQVGIFHPEEFGNGADRIIKFLRRIDEECGQDKEETFRIETDPKVKQSHCSCCGRLIHTVIGFIYKKQDAYAVYSASLHPEESERKMGLTIGLGENWEDESKFKDHKSISLLVQSSETEIQMSILDNDKSNNKASKFWGKRLSRSEALKYLLKDEFFQVADFIVKKDKRINDYLESY